MTLESIGSLVLACIVSAGGVGAIVLAVIKFSSEMIANGLASKYEHELDKKLEEYKTKLSKKEYVSKTRFDAEFEIYRELGKAFCTMVRDISVMIPAGLAWLPADKEAQKRYEDDCYQSANNSAVVAQDALSANSAFIPQEFFESYQEILNLCKRQLNTFSFRYNALSLETEDEKRKLDVEDYKRTEDINKMWNDHNNRIREYLLSLDVL